MPRPPLRPEKIDQLCPAIPAIPAATSTLRPNPRTLSDAISTGNVPFANTSKRTAGTAHQAPACAVRFEAPRLRDPRSRMSIPLANLPIRYDAGIDPTRYALTIRPAANNSCTLIKINPSARIRRLSRVFRLRGRAIVIQCREEVRSCPV